jgi:hypothetical protein
MGLTTGRPITKGPRGTTIGTLMGQWVEIEIYHDVCDRLNYVSGGLVFGAIIAKNNIRFTPSGLGRMIGFRLKV